MSSPFSMFRKYQYSILIVLGVFLMISFLIFPLIQQYESSLQRSGVSNEAIPMVTWNGGKYREIELNHLFLTHVRTIGVLNDIKKAAEKNGGQSKVPVPPSRPTDADLLAMTLLANKATDMGVILSDGALRRYIDLLSDETLSGDDLNKLLHDSSNGELTYTAFMSQLREELLALYAENLRQSAASASTPAQNWENYAKLHRRAVLEMLPLNVQDFVAQVKDEPSDAVIKEWYEKYKNEYPNPNSPEPGFRRRMKIDFAYLKLDFNKLLEEEKSKITDEQVKADYANGLKKGDYKIPKLPEPPPIPRRKPPVNTSNPPKVVSPAPSGVDERPPAPPASANHTDSTPDEKSSDAPGSPGSTDTETPSENGSTPPGCTVVQESPESAQDSTEKKDTQPSAPTDEPTTPSTPSADEKPPQNTDATEGKKEAAAPQPVTDTSFNDLSPINEMPSALDEGIDTPLPRENKSLEEVRESILRRLASPRAEERLKKALTDAEEELTIHFRKYTLWEQSDEAGRKQPTPPSEKDMAAKYGFESGRTGNVDLLEVMNTELGKLRAPPSLESFEQGPEFREVAYNPLESLYKPMTFTRDDDFNMHYIVWKVDQVQESVPSMSDARLDVIAAWKRSQAKKLVVAEANKLLETATKGEGSLFDRLPEKAEKIFLTNEFSWLSSMNPRFRDLGIGPYGISPVENVQVPTENFMKEVFSKKSNELGIVNNAGETVYYVFRIARLSPGEETLREMFVSDFRRGGFQVFALNQMNMEQYVSNLYDELFDEYKVHWNEPPRNHMR